MRPQIVTYAFRQVFHDSAVLYLDGKMTYNGTVYEFDVKKLRELCASKANMVDHGSNSDGHGPMISQINGRTLLLFYYGNVNMGYQIVTYKDITDVIEKSHLLFFQTGGFTLSLIVVMGIILYLSLRKITAPLLFRYIPSNIPKIKVHPATIPQNAFSIIILTYFISSVNLPIPVCHKRRHERLSVSQLLHRPW